MDIHERIKLGRELAGLKKSELARMLDVTPTSCISWELPPGDRNCARPSMENLVKLAVALNVRFEWLATGHGEMLYRPGAQEAAPPYGQTSASLPPDQRALLDAYLALPNEKRQTLLEFLKVLRSLEDLRQESRDPPPST